MGVHGQSKTPRAIGAKPRLVKGHPDFAQKLNRLRSSENKQNRYLLKLIDNTIALLSQGRTLGNSVQHDRWPKKYQLFPEPIPCLFKVDLDANYRMIYSLIKKPNEPLFAWIIEVMTHKEYTQRFGYD